MLLGAAERRIGLADRLARLIADPRNPLFVTHSVADILRARMLAIACGYEDADDLDHLRTDPGFKLACGRLPDSGRDLCSQPTVSRWENAPTLREVVRLGSSRCAPEPRVSTMPQSATGRHQAEVAEISPALVPRNRPPGMAGLGVQESTKESRRCLARHRGPMPQRPFGS